MSKSEKSPENHGQTALLGGDLSRPRKVRTWKEVDEHVLDSYLEAVAEDVPMVDVLDRARRLTAVLDHLSAASSIKEGLQAAIHTDAAEDIAARYGRGTRIVIDRAINKLSGREKEMKKMLGHATGITALRKQTELLLPVEQLNDEARQIWKEFSDTRFGSPENQPAREAYRRKLQAQIDHQVALRQRLGLPTEQPKEEAA